MRRTRTTLTVDERLLRAARIEAAREGKRVYEVIEEALRDRYDLRAGLGKVRRADAPALGEDEAMDLAVAVTRERLALLCDKIIDTLRAWHEAQPDALGPGRPALRTCGFGSAAASCAASRRVKFAALLRK